MALHLKIVSANRDLVDDDDERVYTEAGGTIGRSLKNDWILPDPDRYVSSRHATIDFKGGVYYLLDHSSNGVYFNDEVEPIGKGTSRRLFNGDYLRMGDFEFTVSIDSGESLDAPIDPDASLRSAAPDNLQQFVDEDSLHTTMELLDAEEITGDAAFQNAVFGKKPSPRKPAAQRSRAANDEQPPSSRKSPAASSTKHANDELFDAFVKGLCIDASEIHPSANRAEIMETAGSTMRELIFGVISLLTSRANLKKSFSLDETTLLPRHNNPLKLSRNTDDLLMQLLLGSEGDYLGPSDAIREVFQDLLDHQNAFLDAMNTAFVEFADRFDPDELTESFDRTMTGVLPLTVLKQSRYWSHYRELYPIMTEKGGGRFPQMFGEDFIHAYERQLVEYRRHEPGSSASNSQPTPAVDPGLAATQKLDRTEAKKPAGGASSGTRPDASGPAKSDARQSAPEPTHEKTVEIHPLSNLKG
jgi:type VI secretion system protein